MKMIQLKLIFLSSAIVQEARTEEILKIKCEFTRGKNKHIYKNRAFHQRYKSCKQLVLVFLFYYDNKVFFMVIFCITQWRRYGCQL